MRPDAAAYAALGLRPGADPELVEAAYKALIKRYHPDREGGDAARAAEIIRAYHYLKRRQRDGRVPAARAPAPMHFSRGGGRPLPGRRKARRFAYVVIGVAAILLLLEARPLAFTGGGFQTPGQVQRAVVPATAPPPDPADSPLDADGIERSVADAVRLASAGDMDRLIGQSRRCHGELRRDPDLWRLDRCVAFDEALLVLSQDDPGSGTGPFSGPAVLARQIAAARLISNDYFAMESRLDRVRSQVELALAPAEPPPPPPPPPRPPELPSNEIP